MQLENEELELLESYLSKITSERLTLFFNKGFSESTIQQSLRDIVTIYLIDESLSFKTVDIKVTKYKSPKSDSYVVDYMIIIESLLDNYDLSFVVEFETDRYFIISDINIWVGAYALKTKGWEPNVFGHLHEFLEALKQPLKPERGELRLSDLVFGYQFEDKYEKLKEEMNENIF